MKSLVGRSFLIEKKALRFFLWVQANVKGGKQRTKTKH